MGTTRRATLYTPDNPRYPAHGTKLLLTLRGLIAGQTITELAEARGIPIHTINEQAAQLRIDGWIVPLKGRDPQPFDEAKVRPAAGGQKPLSQSERRRLSAELAARNSAEPIDTDEDIIAAFDLHVSVASIVRRSSFGKQKVLAILGAYAEQRELAKRHGDQPSEYDQMRAADYLRKRLGVEVLKRGEAWFLNARPLSGRQVVGMARAHAAKLRAAASIKQHTGAEA